MTPDGAGAANWQRVRALFETVVDLPPTQRASALERELAAEDPAAVAELRRAVEDMLDAESRLAEFLETPQAPGADVDELELPVVRGFEIVRRIGAGGMGSVYEAHQHAPRRRVALKVLHPTWSTPAMLRRFADEAELLGRLQHPGIARIYEAGVERSSAGELPWFAMELVEDARSLVGYADEEALDLRRRVELLRDVCYAVHHGHQRGVIHRDLKPANLLVDREGRAAVIDFGVARATDGGRARTWATQPGDLVGTLAYMSPEQFAGTLDDLDVRTDVYALGGVLYELLAGRPPFDLQGLGITQAARVVCDRKPPPPSGSSSAVPVELDWVVARALAKDPTERYESAGALARDLERFLQREALEAGPPTATYRLRAFVRRNRLAVGAALVVGLAVVGGLAGTALGLVRALDAEEAAQEDRRLARAEAAKAGVVTDFLVDVLASAGPGRSGQEAPVGAVVQRAAESYRDRFDTRSDVRARLGVALGEVFHGLGLDERAEAELREAVQTLEAHPSASAHELANARGQLGTLLSKSGRLDEAEPLLEASWETHRERGAADRDTYRALGRLGELRLAQQRRDEAEALLREALAGLREVQGPRHRDTCLIANSLAGVLHESHRLEEAEPLYREALDGLRALWGEEHPDTLRLRHNFALLQYSLTDDPERALPEMNAVLAVRRRDLGPDHPDTLASFASLGGLLQIGGRLDEAAELYAEGLADARERLTLDHPTLQVLTMNASALQRQRGAFEEAEGLATDVLEARRRAYGDAAEATLKSDFALVQIDRERGDLGAARARCVDGLALAREHHGSESLFAYHYELELARIELAANQPDEAATWLVDARRTYEAIRPRYPKVPDPTPEEATLARLRLE